MNEFLLKPDQSLMVSLSFLNKLLIVLDNKSPSEKKSFLKQFKQHAEKEPQKAWNYLCKQAQFNHDQDHVLIDPAELFQRHQLTPYIGTKNHGVMFCKKMVIGLKLDLNDTANISYRLDFDETKKLHLNFEIFDGRDQYPFCIPLKFSTGKFGFTLTDKNACIGNSSKEDALLELTKVKFWLKMTIGYTLSCIAQQPGNPPRQNDQNTVEEQLLSFIQGEDDYDFNTVKNYVISLLPGDAGKEKIRMCLNEQDLLTCINHKPNIRAKVRDGIFDHIAGYDESKRFLSGRHHNDDVEQKVDSDTKISSEEPPKAHHLKLTHPF